MIFICNIVLKSWTNLKKGNEELNYNAREFARQLDLVTDNDLFTKGAPLESGMENVCSLVSCFRGW